jgi:hypothetical protein
MSQGSNTQLVSYPMLIIESGKAEVVLSCKDAIDTAHPGPTLVPAPDQTHFIKPFGSGVQLTHQWRHAELA